jgi:hypothetical protein
MSRLYEAVAAALAKGPRATEEVVAECRRSGLAVRPQTVEIFLRLSRDFHQHDAMWSRTGQGKSERIVAALQQAFAATGAYVPIQRLAPFLGERDPVTVEDIDLACQQSGQFRRQGKFIVRA